MEKYKIKRGLLELIPNMKGIPNAMTVAEIMEHIYEDAPLGDKLNADLREFEEWLAVAAEEMCHDGVVPVIRVPSIVSPVDRYAVLIGDEIQMQCEEYQRVLNQTNWMLNNLMQYRPGEDG